MKTDKEKQYRDIHVCPNCFSIKIRKMSSFNGDMLGVLAILPPKYSCQECGWIGRFVILKKIPVFHKHDSTNQSQI